MSQDVAFRRINGRIVPIRLNKQQKEQVKGGAIAALGAGIAVGGGSIYKRSVLASSKAAKKAFDAMTPTPKQFSDIKTKSRKKTKFKPSNQLNFDDFIDALPKVDPIKALRSAKRLAGFSSFVRRASPIVGGSLFVYGSVKAANSSKDKKINPETAALYGAGGAALAPYAVKKGNEFFNLGLQSRQVKMEFAKTAARKFGSKFFGPAF